MSDGDWVDYIQMIRSNNNTIWMDILRIALKHSPDETRLLLKEIHLNDLRIADATGELADGDTQKNA